MMTMMQKMTSDPGKSAARSRSLPLTSPRGTGDVHRNHDPASQAGHVGEVPEGAQRVPLLPLRRAVCTFVPLCACQLQANPMSSFTMIAKDPDLRDLVAKIRKLQSE
jgi:hypothetical protein